jgi:DNA-binding transcriptional MerR regulator
MTQQLFLLGDVARMLAVPPYKITYLIQIGRVQEPAMRLGNRRMFTLHEVKRIAQHLGKHAKVGGQDETPP